MSELDAYFDAYDQVHVQAAAQPDWRLLRRHLRRAMVRPVLQLAWRFLLLAVFVAWGHWGHPMGHLLALGTIFSSIPAQLRRVRQAKAAVAGLSGTDDLREHLIKDARDRAMGAFFTSLLRGLLGVLFLLTGGVAALLGRDFRPGLIAGLIVLGMAAWALLVQMPKATRDGEALGAYADDEDEDDDEEEADD